VLQVLRALLGLLAVLDLPGLVWQDQPDLVAMMVYLVQWERLVWQDLLERPEIQERPVQQVLRERREVQVRQDQQVLLVILELQVPLDPLDPLVVLESLGLPVLQVLPDLLGVQEYLDYPEKTEGTAKMVDLVHPVKMGKMDHLASMELTVRTAVMAEMVGTARMVNLGLLECLVRLV
jgi:hypothetical protein